MKKTALLVLKLAFGIAVFELVLRRIDLAKSVALIHEARPFPLAAAFLSVALSNVLIVSRWKAILDATGFRVPFGRLTAVNLVGIFLSNFLPGSVAGDVVKVFYIVTPQQSGRVMSATFLSRVVGMLATFLLGLLAFPFAAASFKAQPWWAACALALALGAVGSAGLLFPGRQVVLQLELQLALELEAGRHDRPEEGRRPQGRQGHRAQALGGRGGAATAPSAGVELQRVPVAAVPPPRTAPPVPRVAPAPPPAPEGPPREPDVPGQPRVARNQAGELKLLQHRLVDVGESRLLRNVEDVQLVDAFLDAGLDDLA